MVLIMERMNWRSSINACERVPRMSRPSARRKALEDDIHALLGNMPGIAASMNMPVGAHMATAM